MSTMTVTGITDNGLDHLRSGIELQPQARLSNGSLSRPSPVDKHAENLVNTERQGGEDIRSDLPPPSTAVEALQRWNKPRSNMWGVFATFYAFMVFGLNDGAYGVMTRMPSKDAAMLMSLRL